MWVRFTTVHWHRFSRQMKRRYPAGEVRNVPAAVARAAIDAGNAIRMKKPSKSARPEIDDGEAAERG